MTSDLDTVFMKQALECSQAQIDGEVPIGALVVFNNTVISTGSNEREKSNCALDHAEMIAIAKACKTLNSWRLVGCTLYSTLEPCLMCAGALWQARIDRVVYAAKDPQGGALGSLYRIHEDNRLNHRFKVDSGILAEPAAKILQQFFRKKRAT